MTNNDANYQEFLRGNPDGLVLIYLADAQTLLYYGFRRTPKKELVEDAVHHAFCRTFERRGTFQTSNEIRHFLYAEVRKFIRQETRILRNQQELHESQDDLADSDAQDRTDDFDLDRLVKLKEVQLGKAVENLARVRRDDFRAYYYEGKSIAQIALERKRSPDTVRRNIEHAVNKINKYLNAKGLGKIRLFLFPPFF